MSSSLRDSGRFCGLARTPSSQFFLSAVQRGGINTEYPCRLIDGPGIRYHPSHVFVFNFFESHPASDSKLGSHLDDLGEIFSANFVSPTEYDGTLDQIAQFAQIAWPAVRFHRFEGLCGKAA